MLTTLTVSLGLLTMAADPAPRPLPRQTGTAQVTRLQAAPNAAAYQFQNPDNYFEPPAVPEVVEGEPLPLPGGAFSSPVFDVGAGPAMGGGPGGGPYGGCANCGNGHFGPHGSTWYYWYHSSCDMYQHYPYPPALGGYYYFRPYHIATVPVQQRFVTRWGGDPRDPYANYIFDRVYSEIEAERAEPIQPGPVAPVSSGDDPAGEELPPSDPAQDDSDDTSSTEDQPRSSLTIVER